MRDMSFDLHCNGGWDKKEYFIWLSLIKGVGPVAQRRVILGAGSPEKVYKMSADELQCSCGISQGMAMAIAGDSKEGNGIEKAQNILRECERKGIEILTFDDIRYPAQAALSRNMPALLYFIGDIPAFQRTVAIVGARRCSDYGKRVACEAAQFLAQSKVTVVSGMAKGIDSYAHTQCIRYGGHTLAFLAGGVDVCYPKEHISLYSSIAENGALISEYPPGTKPFHKNFVRRNLLMSLWADRVLVVQAGKGSGALTTAEYAIKAQKSLLAVPDRIYEECSIGSNDLIARGAAIYIDKSQLVEGFEVDGRANEKERSSSQNKALSAIEEAILDALDASQKEGLTAEEIKAALRPKHKAVEVERALFEMEMDGLVNVGARHEVTKLF